MTRSWLALLASVTMLAPVVASASGRYDPRLRFQTISTSRFDIHYHQGEEAQARRLAVVAETVAAKLDATLGRASGRVQVILVDQTDLSNGWATPLPFNTIEIAAAAPGGASLIGNTDDWLYLVFAHEYTHIVHLSRGQGWIGGLRRVFGRMPLLYPNLYLPKWQIEGLAVHEESALSGQGRVPDSNFRAIIDVASSASRFEPHDRASGALVDWPSGNAPYVYGGYFHKFLAARHGDASLRQLTDSTAGRIPYFGSRAFKKIFKQSLGELWREFETASRAEIARAGPATHRLTEHGFSVGGPRFAPDGRLYYSIVNPHGFPALFARDPGTATSRKIADRFLGTSVAFAGSEIVFDQVEVENQVGLQSDLYVIGREGGSGRRLTHGARAADPDVSPDGRTIVCTIQRADRRELATLPIASATARPTLSSLASQPGVHFSSPRWSPDGRAIAAERVSTEGRAEIVLIDPATGRVVRVVAPSSGSRSVTPAWLPDGRLLFASDRGGDGFRIFVTDLGTRATSRLEDTGATASSPEPTRDGQTLVFVGYTVDGYDLFSIALGSARWTPVDAGGPDPVRSNADLPQVASEPQSVPASTKSYSPLRTIAPRFWTPTIESDEDELVIGAATGATDALGRHVYAAEAGWAAGRARPDWQLAYAYDRWRPTLFANVVDDTDPWRDGEVRTREGNAGLLFPVRRVRWSQSVLGAFHSSVEELTCSACGSSGEVRAARRALRGGWLLNASRSYGYSISREQGWYAAVTSELTREALGADGNAEAWTVDLRGYLPVVPRHSVIAARVAGAAAWGDPSVRRLFSASGNGPQTLGFGFGRDAIGFVRGLDEDEVVGSYSAVMNVDYRFPLLRIERGVGSWPAFARVLHGAIFVDAGHAWDTAFRRGDIRVSTGAEVSIDTVLGHVVAVTFTAGASWVSHDRGAVAFARIGRAF
jgi:Tol biopolymer transport system component